MRALVVYETTFGTTEMVAESIAAGLRDDMETDVVEVAASTSVHADAVPRSVPHTTGSRP